MKTYPFIGKGNGDMFVLFHKEECGVSLSESCDLFKIGAYYGFFDMEKLTDITAEYLRNTKIKIDSPEHSEMVQRLVFNAGGEWIGGAKDVKHLEAAEIYLHDNLVMTYCASRDDTFFKEQYKEITLPLPPKEDKEMEKPIYTKEMHKRGELPPVGSEVAVYSLGLVINRKVKITYIGDGVGCYLDLSNDTEYTFASNCITFKPLPKPEDELEQSIINFAAVRVSVTWRCIAEAIINGKIKGVKWEG